MINIELFGLFINGQVRTPVSTTKTIPKCNRVVRAFVKESSKILRYNDGV